MNINVPDELCTFPYNQPSADDVQSHTKSLIAQMRHLQLRPRDSNRDCLNVISSRTNTWYTWCSNFNTNIVLAGITNPIHIISSTHANYVVRGYDLVSDIGRLQRKYYSRYRSPMWSPTQRERTIPADPAMDFLRR
jgi:hypothetical protein